MTNDELASLKMALLLCEKDESTAVKLSFVPNIIEHHNGEFYSGRFALGSDSDALVAELNKIAVKGHVKEVHIYVGTLKEKKQAS